MKKEMPNTCMGRKEICFDLVFGTALKDLEVEYLVTQLNGKWCRNYIFRGNDADLTDCLPVPQLVLGSNRNVWAIFYQGHDIFPTRNFFYRIQTSCRQFSFMRFDGCLHSHFRIIRPFCYRKAATFPKYRRNWEWV